MIEKIWQHRKLLKIKRLLPKGYEIASHSLNLMRKGATFFFHKLSYTTLNLETRNVSNRCEKTLHIVTCVRWPDM